MSKINKQESINRVCKKLWGATKGDSLSERMMDLGLIISITTDIEFLKSIAKDGVIFKEIRFRPYLGLIYKRLKVLEAPKIKKLEELKSNIETLPIPIGY